MVHCGFFSPKSDSDALLRQTSQLRYLPLEGDSIDFLGKQTTQQRHLHRSTLYTRYY